MYDGNAPRGSARLPVLSMPALLMANTFEILLLTTVSLFKVSLIAHSGGSPDTEPFFRSALVEDNEAHLDFE